MKKQQVLIKLLENFDRDIIVYILAELAGIKGAILNDNLKLESYRKLSMLSENSNDNFESKLSNYFYDQYRSLRSKLGHMAMRSIFEKNEEKTREQQEKEDKEKSEKARKEAEEKMEKSKKDEQAPLAKAIRSKGDDQSEAADTLGVHKSTISRIKSGTRDPSFDLLQKIKKTYGSGVVNQLLSQK